MEDLNVNEELINSMLNGLTASTWDFNDEEMLEALGELNCTLMDTENDGRTECTLKMGSEVTYEPLPNGMTLDAIKKINLELPAEVLATKLGAKDLTEHQKAIGWDEIELFKRTYKLGPRKRNMESKQQLTHIPKRKVKGGRRRRLAKQVAGLRELARSESMVQDEYTRNILEIQRKQLNYEKMKKRRNKNKL